MDRGSIYHIGIDSHAVRDHLNALVDDNGLVRQILCHVIRTVAGQRLTLTFPSSATVYT